MLDTGAFGRAAVWVDFIPHTHLIPTEKPVGIPTESTYPQNRDIIHTHRHIEKLFFGYKTLKIDTES